ncbi:MAG: NAD(P)H-binding protein, partial [Flavobacterium sp.]|nr:NAD(P)H-binding protein [Flavobacterium sp.]
MENILVAGANGTTGKKIIALLHKSENFNPIAMVRKEEQQAYFKDQNIKTVLGDLTNDVDSVFDSSIDRVIF